MIDKTGRNVGFVYVTTGRSFGIDSRFSLSDLTVDEAIQTLLITFRRNHITMRGLHLAGAAL
jgi:hypothetical protein